MTSVKINKLYSCAVINSLNLLLNISVGSFYEIMFGISAYVIWIILTVANGSPSQPFTIDNTQNPIGNVVFFLYFIINYF